MKPQADLNTLLREKRPISDDPKMLDDYHAGYETAASMSRVRSLAELQVTLSSFIWRAKSEFDWGAVDALADELRKRNGQSPVL